MKVILTQDVRNIGKKDDVKEVSSGYARNYLIPNKFALPATAEELKKLNKKTAIREEEDKEQRSHLEKVARELNDKSIEFTLKVGEDGSVFGSITKEQILKAIRDHFSKHDRIEILLEHPIKEIGEHMVPVDLKKGIEAKLKVIVKPE